MAFDQDTLTLLMAMTSDDKKLAILKEIDDARQEAKAAQADAEKVVSMVHDERAEAQRLKAEAEAMRQSIEGRAAELDAREAKMAEVQQGFQAEHQKWETEVRQPTDAVHIERGKDLAARETAMTFREKEVLESAAIASKAQAKADGIINHYGAMLAELLAVLEKQGALPGTGLDPES